MTIYIDDLTEWKPGKPSAHLGTNGDIEELHDFAARLGLRRDWFQDKDYPHYDIMGHGKYQAAIKAGAKQVSGKEWITLVPRKTPRRIIAPAPDLDLGFFGDYLIRYDDNEGED